MPLLNNGATVSALFDCFVLLLTPDRVAVVAGQMLAAGLHWHLRGLLAVHAGL